jgi:hypothetical protein
MTSFNEWLYQRNENIYNELFEPEGNTQVNQLLEVQPYKENGLNVLELSTEGSNMANNQNIEVMEKANKFGAAMQNYLSEIDSKYNGVLIIGGTFQVYLFGRKNPLVNALSRFTNKLNLAFLKFGKKYIVFSERGYEELKNHFRAEQLSTMLNINKFTPGLSQEEIAKNQARMTGSRSQPSVTKPKQPTTNLPTFAQLRPQSAI